MGVLYMFSNTIIIVRLLILHCLALNIALFGKQILLQTIATPLTLIGEERSRVEMNRFSHRYRDRSKIALDLDYSVNKNSLFSLSTDYNHFNLTCDCKHVNVVQLTI